MCLSCADELKKATGLSSLELLITVESPSKTLFTVSAVPANPLASSSSDPVSSAHHPSSALPIYKTQLGWVNHLLIPKHLG